MGKRFFEMNLVQLAARNLARRPMRSSLSILGVALAVGSAIALVGLSGSIEGGVGQGADERGADLAISQKGSSDLFAGTLPEDLGARLRQVPGVTGAAGELWTFAPTDDDRQVLITGWSQDSFFWKRVPLASGRMPLPGEHNVVLMGDNLADSLAKKVGDDIDVLGEQFQIVGITKYSSTINRGLVVAPLADLQEATYRRGLVTVFNVSLAPGLSAAERADVAHRIEALGSVSVSTTSEILQDDRNVKVLHAVSLATSAMGLAIGVLNVLNTLLMTIQERTREMGILAAIGWSDGRIMLSIIVEGMILCSFGCAFGVVVGFVAALLFAVIPVIGTYISFIPTVGLTTPILLMAFVLCLIGSLYPAWRAVRTTPAAALQRV